MCIRDSDYVSDAAFKDRLEAELLKLPSYQSSIFIKFKANFPEEYSNLLDKTIQQVRGHKNDDTAFNVSNSLIRDFLLKHKEEILISPDANFQEFTKSQIEFIETAQQTNVKKCAEFLNGVVKNEFNDTQSQQPVSYTHLDVYKRQHQSSIYRQIPDCAQRQHLSLIHI